MEQVFPSKTVRIDIRGNQYIITFPNTGQLIRIQELKWQLINNYSSVSASFDEKDSYIRLLVDMIANFTILIPDLKKDINISSMSALSAVESRELLDVYLETFLPWFQNWLNIITAVRVKDEPKTDA